MSEASYSKLDSSPIRSTIEQLRDRIAERFPDSGLSRVASELATVARQNDEVLRQLRQPIWWLRALGLIALVALLALAIWVGALRMLHRFRGLAHILDMHQLTKDPEYVLHPLPTTASSPVRRLTRAELTRYLEYSSGSVNSEQWSVVRLGN